jgi:hypothetical protein
MEKGAGLAISPLAEIPYRVIISELGDDLFLLTGLKTAAITILWEIAGDGCRS